jgi:hypothetical protein
MAKWVKEAIRTHQVDRTLLVDDDLLLLSVPPSFTALSYKKMKAYWNHFKIDDEQNNLLVTYDFGFASIFQQSQGSGDVVLGQIQYVRTLKEIL